MLKIIILILVTTSIYGQGLQYKRSLFSGWKDLDQNCLNTRHEILKNRSKITVKIKKSKGGKCRVISGEWDDFYFNEVLKDAKKIDIDHVVPLKHAWEVGAQEWGQDKRDEFAIDVENLVITNRSYNRSKGSMTILEWMPVDRRYACKYSELWFKIKNKYKLRISNEELQYKNDLKCN